MKKMKSTKKLNKKLSNLSFLKEYIKNRKRLFLVFALVLLIIIASIFIIKTFAVDTGFKSPTANTSDFGGDNNGYQTNPINAYSNDPNYAEDINSGVNNNSSCTSAGSDKHIWYNYSLDAGVPLGAIIKGIEVQQYLAVDSVTDSPFSCIQLSWDGGVTWTNAQSQSLSATAKTVYTFGGPSDLWGRSGWDLSEINNTNFLVRTINGDTNNGRSQRDFYLYWIPVRIYYNNPPAVGIGTITQKTDGSGYIDVQINVSDSNSDDTRLMVEYSDDGGSNWYNPELVSATPDSGSVDLDNGNAYQVGTVDSVDTSGGAINLVVTWDTKSAANGNGSLDDLESSSIQIKITANDGTDDSLPESSSSFDIDNLDPSGLANFDLLVVGHKAISLSWDISSDTNPNKYEVWYGVDQIDVQNKTGSAQGVSINDLNTDSTTVSNLNSDTVYYFKIWAFDNLGNNESVTDISGRTEKSPPTPAYKAPEQPKEEIKYSIYSVSVYELLKNIADKIGIGVEDLISINKGQLLDITKDNWEFRYDSSYMKNEEGENKVEEIKEDSGEKETINEEKETDEEVGQDVSTQRIYIVQPGDNLSSISQKLYGDYKIWYELVKINLERYPSLSWDYNTLSVGWALRY